MRVFHQHQQRQCLRQFDHHRDQRGNGPLPDLARGQFQLGVASLGRDRQQVCQIRRDLAAVEAGARDHHLQLLQPRGGRFAADETGATPDLSDHRIERVVDMVRRALIAQHQMRLVADALAQRGQNARFADAGLSRHQRDLTLALGGLAPAVDQQRDLLFAADKRRHRLRARRFEPADILDFAHDQPGRNRRLEALQLLRSERPELKGPAQQPPRRFGNHHTAGLGERLHPRGEIWRIPDHAALARLALADQFADHDQAGRNADADLQRNAAFAPKLRPGLQ